MQKVIWSSSNTSSSVSQWHLELWWRGSAAAGAVCARLAWGYTGLWVV